MSTFIQKSDYYVGSRQSTIDQLTDDDDSLLDKAERYAEKYVKRHLHAYDTDTIFSQIDDDRDEVVLQWCIDITLYRIYNRTDDAFVPDSIIKNYDDALTDLDKISQGRKTVDLPRLAISDTNPAAKTKFRWGGTEARSIF